MSLPVRWKLNNSICDAYESIDAKSSALHGHQHFLITLVTQGTGIQTLNGKEIYFKPNDLFMLSPADFHKNTVHEGEHFNYYGVKFSYELLDSRLFDYYALNRLPIHLRLSEQNAASIRAVFSNLVEESQFGRNRIANHEYLQLLIEQLFILVLREIPHKSDSYSGSFINRALGYIHSHFNEPISVNDAANYVGYTPNYFNFCFREQTGVPFGVYLREMRLTYAENLLKASKLSITEIAMETGFGSISHFSRSFHEKNSVSPKDYRNNFLKII